MLVFLLSILSDPPKNTVFKEVPEPEDLAPLLLFVRVS